MLRLRWGCPDSGSGSRRSRRRRQQRKGRQQKLRRKKKCGKQPRRRRNRTARRRRKRWRRESRGEQPLYSRNRTAGWRQKEWRRMCRLGPEWRQQGRRRRRFMSPSFPCAICSRNTTGMPCGRSSAENTNRRLCLRSGIRSASSWN